MSHWFHRNPIKPTGFAKYELKGVLTSDASRKICGELRLRRTPLLELFRNASNGLEDVDTHFKDYMQLLYGFLLEIPSALDKTAESSEPPKESKLRPLHRYSWGHSMMGTTSTALSDTWFEALSLLTNMAMWLSKHAAFVAGKDEVRDCEAKEVLTCLRRAAGIMQFVRENMTRISSIGTDKELTGSDLDPKVLEAYALQFQAEAQEVVVARAIELKHNHLLISTLATNTASMFRSAELCLASLHEETFSRWRCYLQMKSHFYIAYGFAFLGESLLAEDKCGEAVRACKEGMKEWASAQEWVEKYSKATGPGTRCKPEEHLFYRRIEPLLKRHLDKAERENGFIYHQKVPDDCPVLSSDASYGVTKPESYEIPAPHELWSSNVYASFDLGKANMPDFSKVKKTGDKLETVKEEKIYQTEKDPSNSSGCVIA